MVVREPCLSPSGGAFARRLLRPLTAVGRHPGRKTDEAAIHHVCWMCRRAGRSPNARRGPWIDSSSSPPASGSRDRPSSRTETPLRTARRADRDAVETDVRPSAPRAYLDGDARRAQPTAVGLELQPAGRFHPTNHRPPFVRPWAQADAIRQRRVDLRPPR
jgi:hypothetical protein